MRKSDGWGQSGGVTFATTSVQNSTAALDVTAASFSLSWLGQGT